MRAVGSRPLLFVTGLIAGILLAVLLVVGLVVMNGGLNLGGGKDVDIKLKLRQPQQAASRCLLFNM